MHFIEVHIAKIRFHIYSYAKQVGKKLIEIS